MSWPPPSRYDDALGVPLIARATPALAFSSTAMEWAHAVSEPRSGDGGVRALLLYYELRMAFFRDPAGNLLAIMAEQGVYRGPG